MKLRNGQHKLTFRLTASADLIVKSVTCRQFDLQARRGSLNARAMLAYMTAGGLV